MQLLISPSATVMENRISNIKTDVREMAQGGVDWIKLTHDKTGSQHTNKYWVSTQIGVLLNWLSDY
jgi:hypothetical protein